MASTQIRGTTQIKAGTIEDAQIASAAAIALSKLAEAVLQADGGQALTGDLPAGTHKITGLGDPTNPQDAATRAWVLTQVAGLSTNGKVVRAATTVDITLEDTQTVNAVALSAGNRVLVKNQAAPAENGIYDVVAGGPWTRSVDTDVWAEVPGSLVVVEEGGQADTLWLSTADAGGTLDTTAITFIQLPGPSDLLAGDGLDRSGQTISAKLDGGTLAKSSSGLKVAAAGITATELAAAVAGAGLSGGAGSALDVNVDGTTIQIATDTLGVKAGGIGETQLGAGTYVLAAHYIARETPTGTVNGSNTTFTLAHTPVSGKEMIFLNGLLQEGGGEDYTLTTNSVAFASAPATGDRIRATYIY